MAQSGETSRWTKQLNKGLWGRQWASSREGRLVLFIGGEANVKPIGTYWVRPFSSVTAVGLVEMTPKTVDVPLECRLTSKDGVDFNAVVSITLSVIDTDSSIRRVALNPVDEERLIIAELGTAWQRVCVTLGYVDILKNRSMVVDSVMNLVTTRAKEIANHNLFCFKAHSMSVKELKAIDEAIGAAVLERLRLEESAQTEKIKLQKERELTALQAASKMKELLQELRRSKLIEGSELKLQLEKFNAQIEQDKQKKKLEMEEIEARAKIAATGTAGLWAIEPEAAKQIELRRLTEYREVLLKMLPSALREARREGREEVLVKLFEDKMGISFDKIELTTNTEGLLQDKSVEQQDKKGEPEAPKLDAAS